MATKIVPASRMREDHNVRVGYGEVPAFDFSEEVIAWGLPSGRVTFSEEEAIKVATQLDKEIRKRLTDVNQLLHVNGE